MLAVDVKDGGAQGKTAITQLTRISWRTVGTIIARVTGEAGTPHAARSGAPSARPPPSRR
jgi:hypothetical protein